MGKVNLNIRYHNPNTDEETLKHILKMFIEASRVKLENVLQVAAEENSIDIEEKESPIK